MKFTVRAFFGSILIVALTILVLVAITNNPTEQPKPFNPGGVGQQATYVK